MISYFRYLTQLDLAKEIMGKNDELSRISLILIDDCLELFCSDYLSNNYPKENEIHSSIDFKKRLQAVIQHNDNNKVITPYVHSIVLLFHYYRNKLYHKGELEGINLIYEHLGLFFNAIVDIILSLSHKEGFWYNVFEDYVTLFKKYVPECSTKSSFAPIDYETVKEAFLRIKCPVKQSLIRDDFIKMLKFLVSEWDDEIKTIHSFSEMTIPNELKHSLDYHPQRVNPDFMAQYVKHSKDADKILDEFEKIKKYKKEDRFFSDVLKFETRLLFLLELINESFGQVERIIDWRIDYIRLEKAERANKSQ